ncbi:hypothetical protein [Anoxybacillus sp. FSL W8-1294]|uniref:hypothetical protein n=1 Tax=Anoxybacillus sp. FSL W8-1294 TaxID=2954655 RepID=UPI0030CEE684
MSLTVRKKIIATVLPVLLLFFVVSMLTYNRLQQIDEQYYNAMKEGFEPGVLINQ